MILTVTGGVYLTRADNADEEDEMLKSDGFDDAEIEDEATKVKLIAVVYSVFSC